MTKKRPLYLLFIAALTTGLSSCLTPPMNDDINAVQADVDKKINKHTPISDRKHKTVITKCSAYVDTTPVSLKQPPYWLQEQVSLKGRTLPFDFYMKDLLKGTDGLTLYQESGIKNTLLSFDYSGPLKGALDYMAAQADYSYDIQDRTIRWSKYLTKTIDVSFMPGSSNYFIGDNSGDSSISTGGSSGSGGGSSSSAGPVVTGSSSEGNQFSNFSGKISVWDDLRASIKNLLSPEGKISVSEATTSITVKDRPGNVATVEKYLIDLNKELSRQVLIKVQILEFTSNKGFDYGIDWNLIAGSLGVQGAMSQPVTISGFDTTNSPAFSWIILPQASDSQKSGSAISPTNAFMSALNEQGKTTVVTQPTVMTLNNQVAEININKQSGYLAEVTTTVTGTSGTSQTALTPGIVNSGFTIYVLPKIQKDRIYLQITSNLSNPPTFAKATSGGQTIQTPTLSEKRFNQRALVPSGGTLVLSGYRQVDTGTAKNSFYGLGLFGGVGAKQNEAESIVLVTPVILGSNDE